MNKIRVNWIRSNNYNPWSIEGIFEFEGEEFKIIFETGRDRLGIKLTWDYAHIYDKNGCEVDTINFYDILNYYPRQEGWREAEIAIEEYLTKRYFPNSSIVNLENLKVGSSLKIARDEDEWTVEYTTDNSSIQLASFDILSIIQKALNSL